MKEHHEKIIIGGSTLILIFFLVTFLFFIVTGKTISFREGREGVSSAIRFIHTRDVVPSHSAAIQSLASTGDTHTLFFGGRILTNPDTWSFRRLGIYRCPAIEFFVLRGAREDKVVTVVDTTFCNPRDMVVPFTLEIIPRGNLLFYIHTDDIFYSETLSHLIESVQ